VALIAPLTPRISYSEILGCFQKPLRQKGFWSSKPTEELSWFTIKMENRNVGFLITGIAIIIGIIILIFNLGLKKIVGQTCTHGSTCTMYDTITIQTWISLAVAGLVLIIGLFLIFSKQSEKIVVKRVKERVRNKKIDLNGLDKDERLVVELLQGENGVMFQSNLMEKLEVGKVKITRLLDKLEAKGLVERKRRGMNNIVVLKS